MTSSWGPIDRLLGVLVGVAAIGFLLSLVRPGSTLEVTHILEYQDQLELVFLVSATCAGSRNIPDGYVHDLQSAIQGVTADSVTVRVVGVAVDDSWEEGVEFLRGLGEFDEVLAGRSWLGTGAKHFIHRDLPGPAVIPQVVVIRRAVRRPVEVTEVGADRVLIRKVGLDEMLRWQSRGFPLPLAGST